MGGASGRIWRTLLLAGVLAGSALVLPAARASTGGPDSYGYIWVDNRSPSPTFPYSWVDILSRGVRIAYTNKDGCTFEVYLGFQFRFYGTVVDNVFICANGFITIGVPDSLYPDPPIPSPAIPNNRIVALGLDLDPIANGGVYFYSMAGNTPKRFVITWNAVYIENTNRAQTFQIILEQNETSKDGRVIMQYQSLNNVGSPLVGIENRTGSSGLAYPNPLGNQLAVAFLPPTDQGLPPDLLRISPASLAPFSVAQGTSNVGMMRLDLSTATNNITVTAIRFELTGAGSLLQDVPTAQLWLDDGDLAFNPVTDSVIASVGIAGSPPAADLQFKVPLGVAVGSPRRVYLAFTIASTAVVGDLVGAVLRNGAAVSVNYPDVVSNTSLPFDTYVPGNRTRITASRDTLLLTRVFPLAPAEVAQWDTDVPAIELEFDADHNFVPIAGVRVRLGGTARASDVWAIKLLLDGDGDRNYTPGVDTVLAIATPSGVPAAANLPFNLTITAGAPQDLLILMDIAPNAVVGRLLNLTVVQADVTLPAGSVDIVSGANYPAASGPINIVAGTRPTLRLPWITVSPSVDGIWQDLEYPLGPANTAVLDRPVGNEVPGYVTASNNGTRLFLAVDATQDRGLDTPEGVALGFDTDRNGAPTDGMDDVFWVNATSASHLQYNAGAGGWVSVSNCTMGAGNASLAYCGRGIGATGFRTTPHRFYELSIPLASLNVTTIPPNTTIRFAVAAPPYFGLTDGGNRSTWPFLFGPAAAPLEDYGDLLLATGFVPNSRPHLDWTGEPGYTSDAVDPDLGNSSVAFQWRITYSDPDTDAPALGEPKLHVSRDGFEISGSPFAMRSASSRPNYFAGAIFLYTLTDLLCAGNYTYEIDVRDARGLSNATPVEPGPIVECPNLPPTLFSPSVTPLVDQAGASFTYRVAYADTENETPTYVRMFVDRGGVAVGSQDLNFTTWVGPPNFVTGAWFRATMRLDQPGFNYTFRFRAADANGTVETEDIFGPYVLVPPPHVLTVAGLDQAPLVVDQGQRMVPFLNVYLTTASPDVDVTGIRVDRIGSSTDGEVSRILLYTVVAGNLTLLGSRPPFGANHSAVFPVDLRVLQGQSLPLYFFIDVSPAAVAEDTIGLELKNESYITVGPGDLVQSFFAYKSTRALVNGPPAATNLAVNGFAGASPGILHIVGANPALSWRFTDPNAADLAGTKFNVSVSRVSPPTVPWFRNESGSLVSVPYTGPPLVVGASYVLQVSVFDGRLWSAPSTTLFRVNTPPPIATPFFPANQASDVSPTTNVLWNPVADIEGDLVTYWYWVSSDVGFANPISATTVSPGSPALQLATGTTYYWKVAASDGWQVGGNSTVWQFTTASGTVARGTIVGRVLNGTAPLPDALVQILVNSVVVAGNTTIANGTFRFANLDFVSYTVRVGAFGFKMKVLAAAPTRSNPVYDMGDIVLIPEVHDGGGPFGGNSTGTLPAWAVVLIPVLLAMTIATSLFGLIIAVRRRRREPDDADEPEAEAGLAVEPPGKPAQVSEPKRGPVKEASPPLPQQKSLAAGARSSPTTSSVPAKKPAPAETRGMSAAPPPKGSQTLEVYECPECGRFVSADAKKCECGAIFES